MYFFLLIKNHRTQFIHLTSSEFLVLLYINFKSHSDMSTQDTIHKTLKPQHHINKYNMRIGRKEIKISIELPEVICRTFKQSNSIRPHS